MRQGVLRGLYRLTRYSAWWVLLVVFSLAIVSLYAIQDLRVDSSFQTVLPRNDPILAKFEEHQEALQETEEITVLLKLASPPSLSPGEGAARLLQAAQRVAEVLAPLEEIASVSYRQESETPALPINLLSLSEEGLQTLRETLAELQKESEMTAVDALPEEPLAEAYAEIRGAIDRLVSGLAVLNPQKLIEALQNIQSSLERLRSLNGQVDRTLRDLPTELTAAEQAVEGLSRLVGSWQSALQPPTTPQEVLFSKDKRALLVRVKPTESSRFSLTYNRRVTEEIRRALSALDLERLGIEWGLKGPYVFTVEGDDALRRDMNRTAGLTILGVLALFIVVLKRFFYPLLATFPVLIALLLTLAAAEVLFGGLNLLTAFLPAIVFGLGIDYGIQFISHYIEERRGTRRMAPALRRTIFAKGSAMLVAASVTSLVLFGLGAVSGSPGLSQMGFILGLGVLLSCLLTLIALPAMIVAVHSLLGKRLHGVTPRPWDLGRPARLLIRGRWAVLALVIAGSAWLALPAAQVRFAFVTETLIPTNLPSLKVRDYILDHFELRQVPDPENYFLFFVDADEEAVRTATQELRRLEAVDQITSYYSVIPDPGELDAIKRRLADLRSLDVVRPLRRMVETLRALRPQLEDHEALRTELERLEDQLAEGSSTVLTATEDEELAGELDALRRQTQAVRERLEGLPISELQGRVQVLLVKIEALADRVESITASIPSPEAIDRLIENPPPAVREKFFTPEGKAILYAHVRSEWLWDSVLYDEFIRQASRISDDFLGLPMFRATLETYMKRDFWRSTGLAVLIIFFVLRLDFAQRGMRVATWLSLLTLGLGYLWLLGTMGLLKIDFNVANVLLSPLLIGLGVDNCVYLLHRYRDFGGRSVERALASTGLPILANTLATMIGFGSLMLAETPVLRVLGESAVMGICFMTLLSLTFLPAVLSLRRR